MATADHVLDKTRTGDIQLGFRNENPVGTFGPNGFNFEPLQTVVARGAKGIPTTNGWAGGGVDKPDIGFIGATIDLDNVGGDPPSGLSFLNSTKATLLVSAAGDAVPLASIAADVFPQFTFHGYGNSGRAPTAAEIANVGGAGDYAYLRHNNADDEDYGILRPLSDTITILEYENARNGSLAGAPYKYDQSLGWQLTAGKGYGLSGDSGAALVDANGKIIGIFNLSQSDTFDPAVANIVEGVKLGHLQNAVALTQDYVDWFNGRCERFLSLRVPEPSSTALLIFACVLGMVHRAKRSAR